MNGQMPPKDDGPRINEAITNANVLLIDAEGEKRGVMKIEDALDLAAEAGMDLVEVSPNADTPVCKVLDYGKYKYQAQKKANEAKKKQKVIEAQGNQTATRHRHARLRREDARHEAFL